MPAITTADLFSRATIRDLIVEPVFQTSIVLNSGLRRLDTDATTTYLPSVKGGTAGWYNELEPIADAGVDPEMLAVTPKAVKALQDVSNEAANDTNAAQIIGDALTGALARQVDSAFFVGAGPKGPTGLPGITGVTPVDGDVTEGLDAFVDAIAAVEAAGATAGAIYMNPADWASLSKVKATTDSATPVLNAQAGAANAADRRLFGVPVYTSPYVVQGVAWVLDPNRVFVVQRTPATVDVDRSFLFNKDGTSIRATMRLEFAAPQPGTIAKVTSP